MALDLSHLSAVGIVGFPSSVVLRQPPAAQKPPAAEKETKAPVAGKEKANEKASKAPAAGKTKEKESKAPAVPAPAPTGPPPAETSKATDASATSAIETNATKALTQAGISFQRHPVNYDDVREGESLLASFARQSGGTLANNLKSMVFETGLDTPAMVLMSHDWKVDPKKLAAKLGASTKKVKPASQERATEFTGYQFGGTTPIGILQNLPIFAQMEAQEQEVLTLNGGSRELVVTLQRADLERVVGGLEYCDLAKKG